MQRYLSRVKSSQQVTWKTWTLKDRFPVPCCCSSAVTSRTRYPSCMYRGSMALRSSMVSYWPWQAFSFSLVPSMHLSSTKPTRKIIFTPERGKRARGLELQCEETLVYSLCTIPDTTASTALEAIVTITEEHVPNTQHGSPRQRSGEGTHKPFSHVEDGVDLVFLQMAEG